MTDDPKQNSEERPSTPLVYTVAEAQAILKIGRSGMYELLRQHDGIVPIRIGSKLRIPASELERFVRERHEAAKQERSEPLDAGWKLNPRRTGAPRIRR